MKNKLIICMGPLLLWACSVDPTQKDRLPQNPISSQTADSIREHEGIVESGGDVAANGSVVEVPVEEVKANPNPDVSKPQEPSIVDAGRAPDDENENTVTKPGKITGAFLVGEVISDESSATLQVGIIAKQEDIRLSTEPDRFELKWKLQAHEDVSVRLLATKNPNYDRILEFDGTREELEQLGNEIAIHLMVSETEGETKLENAVKTTFSELFEPIVNDYPVVE